MTKPSAIHLLIDLAQSRTDASAQRLGGLTTQYSEIENQLQVLLQYRDEYCRRYEDSAKNGISATDWRNFQQFLAKLDKGLPCFSLLSANPPVLDLLESMTADSLEASSLDPETLALVRIAALAAVDAPPISYLLNLGLASEIGIDAEQVRGVLAAIAPIVGTARIASATGKIVEVLEVAIETAELEEEGQETT
jgi:alkylhydroperoxidase/carboxymuconolactone decarboxylase family protein YurZ